ncbi:MAG: hypothetical protein M3P98_04260 [bacterium]|nr:hypothetical protein [bacterium]
MKTNVRVIHPIQKFENNEHLNFSLTVWETENGQRYSVDDEWISDHPLYYGKDYKDGKQIGWDNPEYFPLDFVDWANKEILNLENV